MIRLTILTLIALFAVLSLFGAPDDRPGTEPAQAQPAQPEADPEQIRQAATSTASSTTGAAPIAAAVVEQTPERVQQFPGPPLQPSPEYAGQAAEAEVQQLAASGAEIMYVTGDRVNFRAGPSTNDRVIGALLRGSPIEVMGQTDNGWVNLRDAQGREGYMSAQFLSATP